MIKHQPKDFIQGAIKHPGALTAKAKHAGKTVAEFEKSPGKHPSAETRHQIQFAEVLSGVRPKGKK